MSVVSHHGTCSSIPQTIRVDVHGFYVEHMQLGGDWGDVVPCPPPPYGALQHVFSFMPTPACRLSFVSGVFVNRLYGL